jgi:hypothetical protein
MWGSRTKEEEETASSLSLGFAFFAFEMSLRYFWSVLGLYIHRITSTHQASC